MRRKLFGYSRSDSKSDGFLMPPEIRPKTARKLLKRAVNQFCFLKVFGQVSGRFSDRFSGRLSGTVSGPPFWVNFQVFGRTVFGSTWGQLLAKLSGAEHCMRISSNFNIALEINCCAKFVQIKNNKNREKHAGKTA